MRIGRDRQRQPAVARFMRRFVEEHASNSAPPQLRLDEQSIEFAPDHRRESRNASVELGDVHLSVGDLRRRQMDGVGMRLKVRAVILIRQRRAPLQLFQLLPFLGLSGANDEGVSAL
jgi:hypothetical protein